MVKSFKFYHFYSIFTVIFGLIFGPSPQEFSSSAKGKRQFGMSDAGQSEAYCTTTNTSNNNNINNVNNKFNFSTIIKKPWHNEWQFWFKEHSKDGKHIEEDKNFLSSFSTKGHISSFQVHITFLLLFSYSYSIFCRSL